MSEETNATAGENAPGETWAPLLAAAPPRLYAGSPFRRLGLPATAGAREVARRLEQLRMSVELGAPEFGWAFAPSPVPNGEQLRDAAQQLKDAVARLVHEFFWFWSADYPEEGNDSAMTALLAGDADGAFLQWQRAAEAGQIVAVHNLAVFHHLAALETELAGGALEEEATEWWRTAIAQWAQVRASEEIWERLRRRIERLADARIPTNLPELVRQGLPEALCGIHATLAIVRAQKTHWHEAGAHVRFARQVHDVPARAERALEGAIGKVVQGVDLLLRDTARRLTGDGSVGLTLTAGLLAEAADELEVIETICGRDSEVYREVSTRVVDAALEGIIAYQRRTLDSCGVLPWLTHLTTLVATPEVRRRLEETADILHGNAIVEKLPPADPAADAAANEAAEFEAAYRLLQEEFVPGVDRLDLGPRARADYLANVRRALRELAHAACYQLEHFDLAARALATAAEISDGAERAALQQEREQLLLEIVRRKARGLAAERARAAEAESVALAETPAAEPIAETEATANPPAEGTVAPAPESPPETGPEKAEGASAATGKGRMLQSELPLWSETAAEPGVALAGAIVSPEAEPEAAMAGVPAAPEAAAGAAAPAPAGPAVLRAFGGNQAHFEVAGHRLDLNPVRLAFDGVTLAPEEITGLRYGVADMVTEQGLQRWHRISWCSADRVVSLDETNLLQPASGQPVRLYNLILETLYGVVVPGLLVRLVEAVRRGEAVPLGRALLRRDGLALPPRTFNWPREKVVPYSEIAHAIDDGDFVVHRIGEEDDTERFALAEIWNAALAGHVIDALATDHPPLDTP